MFEIAASALREKAERESAPSHYTLKADITDEQIQELKNMLSGAGSIMVASDDPPSVEIVPRWIPVTERLPEEHDSVFAKMYGTNRWMPGMFRTLSDTVIVCVEGTDGRKKTAAMHTKDRKWDMSARHLRGDKVTHWMPLPEPPKGEWLW